MSTADERQHRPPRIDERAFNCPHCGAYAHQYKYQVSARLIGNDKDFSRRVSNHMSRNKKHPFMLMEVAHSESRNIAGIYFLSCSSCNELSVWILKELIWPPKSDVPLPNPDLPDNVRRDYEEAGAILGSSPRGAAALLRLGIQKLCKHLGGSGDSLNSDISMLVKNGLPIQIRQALDTIRVVGNNAVHPGQIDLKDDIVIARSLFDLVNLIADSMISQPKQISQIYEKLPEDTKQAIEKRDAR